MSEKKLTPYLAVARAEGFCEGEGATRKQQIEAWQYLIDHDICWSLQGWFGRTAMDLIKSGICHAKSQGSPKKTGMRKQDRKTSIINKVSTARPDINKNKAIKPDSGDVQSPGMGG